MLEEILNEIMDVNLFKFYEKDFVVTPEKALPNLIFIIDHIIIFN